MQGLSGERTGLVQMALLALLGVNYSMVAMNHALPTFHAHTPPFHCKADNTSTCLMNNSSSGENACPQGYQFDSPDGERTIVSEWQLVCDRRLLLPLAATLYFSGVTVGAVLCGALADRLGRRIVMLVCLFTQAALGFAMYFVQSLIAFMALRTVQGFFVQGLQGSTYTLLVELFPPRTRTAVGVILEVYWALGLAALAGCAYLVPDWRFLQITLAAPSVLTLFYICMIPESPRWLSARGHHEEAQKVWSKLSPQTKEAPMQLQENMCHEAAKYKEIAESCSQIVARKTKNNNETFTINDLKLKLQEKNPENSCVTGSSGVNNEQDDARSETAFSTDGLVHQEKNGMIVEKGNADQRQQVNTVNTHVQYSNGKAVTLSPKKGQGKFMELLTKRVVRKHSFVMTFIWFSVSLSYYGIMFYMPALAGERHLNFLVGAVLEIPAYLIGFYFLSRYGRRIPLCCYLLVSGAICAAIGGISIVPDGTTSWIAATRTTLTLLGKMGLVSAFCSIFLYTSELFPTVLRAAAMGLCGFWGRTGSLISPQLLLLGEFTSSMVPLMCMGVLCLAAGVFTLALPETLGQTLPDTVEEVQMLADKKTRNKLP